MSSRSGLAPVNGLRMYYEVHGQGPPVVLLHGAMSSIQPDFARMIPVLARTRQVIAVEQQGHGHTADVDRPLSNEQMADDTAELLRHLGISNTDLVGYSMGGAVALMVARRHPDLARKVVFFGGAAFGPQGLYPELFQAEESMGPEALEGTPWQQAYARMAPDPDAWPALVNKIKEMDLGWTGWADEDVAAVKAPVMLVIGDSDIVRPEHAAEMFRLLGGGVPGDLVGLPRSRLAILPGTTHVSIVDRVDWLLSMITEFLDAPMPEAAQ
jgi:pimeloyl-ACP methyl ester carboxylesterase